jgi:putative flippase GtrA
MKAGWMATGDARRKLLLRFAAVGTVGFIVDAVVLTVLSQWLSVNVYLARCCSFVVACLVTWLLNRTLVFESSAATAIAKQREYGRYFLVQSGGAAFNMAIFSALIALVPTLQRMPVIPLAVASCCALVFNFAGSRLWVFGRAS